MHRLQRHRRRLPLTRPGVIYHERRHRPLCAVTSQGHLRRHQCTVTSREHPLRRQCTIISQEPPLRHRCIVTSQGHRLPHQCIITSQERRPQRLSAITHPELGHRHLLATVLLHRTILGLPRRRHHHTAATSALTWAVTREQTLRLLQPLPRIVTLLGTREGVPSLGIRRTTSLGTTRTARMLLTTRMSCLATTRMRHTRSPSPSPGKIRMLPITEPMTRERWVITLPGLHLLHLDHRQGAVT